MSVVKMLKTRVYCDVCRKRHFDVEHEEGVRRIPIPGDEFWRTILGMSSWSAPWLACPDCADGYIKDNKVRPDQVRTEAFLMLPPSYGPW